VPGPGRWVAVVIEDSGAGIAAEHLGRIFEPYYTTKENGSGLGLATSYSIVKNHGGMIEVSSLEQHGSAFTIWLPASEVDVQLPSTTAAPASLPQGRVLVMDDEEVVRDAVGEMLDALGQTAVFAADGAAAIEAYVRAKEAGAPFDVVILDATVRGGMGGGDAIKRLRELDPAVTAVISSGYADNAIVANYTAYGFKAFLPKPFSYGSLQAVLGSLMQEHPATDGRPA
jgi:CheY-like chemotaxis protein